ncbi:MAG: DUF4435 domain-containing protein [Rikenellaceae bacterium]
MKRAKRAPSCRLHNMQRSNSKARLVRVFVEGYEDVAFWRSIFDHFGNPYLRFEISVPVREDLPKGKKILLGMIPSSSEDLLLCVDSDFDFLFHNLTEPSRELMGAEYMFHTYTYATENHLCYAPSLHNVCVKATKNDTQLFDFVSFMAEYSKAIYPAFLWYVYSASLSSEHIFILTEFKSTVRLNYLDLADNGERTVCWVAGNVRRKCERLAKEHPDMVAEVEHFSAMLNQRGVTPETTYLYMHGHTLMDNVVMVALNAVCDRLRQLSIARIENSSKSGVALKNEMSNYNNSLRSIRDVLLDNENYTSSPLYKRLHRDIGRYIKRTILRMKSRGEIKGKSLIEILVKLKGC